ncbi:calcium/sodium antiporter [Candidatus Gracilibacteria bacterium]|nr:calcium/sodium antiporter [Candidatus Gracilibacteria bacterium]
MVTEWLILIASLIVLGVAANYLVGSSVKIARIFGIPEILIGLTIVAWGTSAPEIGVSITAALEGKGALSVGNVIGSNIFNLGFILGTVAIIATQKISKKMVYRDCLVLMLSTLMVLAFVWDNNVTQVEGAIMLTCLFAYMAYLFIKKDVPTEDLEAVEEALELPEIDVKKKKWIHILVFLVSLYVLVKAADYTVESAVAIATVFGISEWAIGVTIVAAGTSLPEVATSVMATIKRKFDISIGNVIGSDIFNALGIIGVSSVIAPLVLKPHTSILGFPDYIFSQLLLVATLVLIVIFMRSGWRLSRWEGITLLTIAVARMGFEIYIGM